ncbi:replication initiator [Catenulispora rubra]|uniref:replication initiator n=1 Tax=Catenulispora rubra TaxID=280293 RepID=UPI001E2A02D5|nr:replication initiator [Catenulispora rubra]
MSDPTRITDSTTHAATLANVPFEDRGWYELLSRPDYPAIEQQIRDVGACEHPIWLSGRTLLVNVATGAIIDAFRSDATPFGAIPIRCMNRRATRCAPCSRLYAGDAFHLVRAGLAGGKGVPTEVIGHPLVFATFTAPSFGPVHRRPDPRRPRDLCRPRRGSGTCLHGNPRGCALRHDETDVLIGQPLCSACYDYPGHVLWNAKASALWARMIDFLYWRLARAGSIKRSRIRRTLRVEYTRLAEYQARGLVHFHAAIRLDGPDDRSDDPPAWATAELLTDAVLAAARSVVLTLPETKALGAPVLRFGTQLDVRPVVLDSDLPPERVAGYLAKYVTKGTEEASGTDVPVTHRSQINPIARTPHVRALMHTCRTIGALPGYEELGLHRWTHMLGFGGHVLSKTRRYSTTLSALRQARADHNSANRLMPDDDTIRDGHWSYAGRGWPTAAIAEQAAGIADELAESRELSRESGQAS